MVGKVARHGPDLAPLRVNDLLLAVSEACTNAIDAYVDDGRIGEMVEVDVVVGHGSISVEVVDHAGGFRLGRARATVPTAHPVASTQHGQWGCPHDIRGVRVS